jgi:hypothetical protein
VSWDLFLHCFVHLAGSIRKLSNILLGVGDEAFANSWLIG